MGSSVNEPLFPPKLYPQNAWRIENAKMDKVVTLQARKGK